MGIFNRNHKKYKLVKNKGWLARDEPRYRLKASRNIYRYGTLIARKDELGGAVESQDSLSQDGDSWARYGTTIKGGGTVSGNALVTDSAVVNGGSVRDAAMVCDNAVVNGCLVQDAAMLTDDATAGPWAVVKGRAILKDRARLYREAPSPETQDDQFYVAENHMAQLSDDAVIGGASVVSGHVAGMAQVIGDSMIDADSNVYGWACVEDSTLQHGSIVSHAGARQFFDVNDPSCGSEENRTIIRNAKLYHTYTQGISIENRETRDVDFTNEGTYRRNDTTGMAPIKVSDKVELDIALEFDVATLALPPDLQQRVCGSLTKNKQACKNIVACHTNRCAAGHTKS